MQLFSASIHEVSVFWQMVTLTQGQLENFDSINVKQPLVCALNCIFVTHFQFSGFPKNCGLTTLYKRGFKKLQRKAYVFCYAEPYKVLKMSLLQHSLHMPPDIIKSLFLLFIGKSSTFI